MFLAVKEAFSVDSVLLDSQARAAGCLVGLAAGDALGAAVEFQPRDTFVPLTDMRAGGPHDLEAGQWTDDTSMALAMGASLLATGRMDRSDQLRNYCRWLRHGDFSSTGTCFDFGNQVYQALSSFEVTGDEQWQGGAPDAAGNGSLMRLAPAAIAYHRDVAAAEWASGYSSTTTHPAVMAVDSCRGFGRLLALAIQGATREELYADAAAFAARCDQRVAAVFAGSFRNVEREQVNSDGFVVHSMEAALWAFDRSSSFAEGALLAANLGDDADTVAAIFGQLAGAFYGLDGIPERWRVLLSDGAGIERMAVQLAALDPQDAPAR